MSAETQAPASTTPDSGNKITRHPIIGVLAVLIGVNISVSASRLLAIALPDLRGILGIGIDEGAWIPTALNAAQMFMGPMAIALGAVFGHRKVLLVSCVIYILSSLVAPLVPDWHVVVAFQIIRGLSSGTFYPLTLSFVTQNLPRPWITFGLAAYALDVLGSNHLAFPLYSFYHAHLSWHWIFWNSIAFTAVMLVCVIWGMPIQKPLPKFHKLRFLDFLYTSTGLTFLYVGFDQGERCDWFNSGLINGLFIAGILTLILAAYSRLKTPNPLVDFRFLKNRNIILLSYVLTVYFVSLLGTFALLPRFFISLHSYRPLQVVELATIGGTAAAIVAPLMAVAIRVVDPRLLAAAGLALMSVAFFGEAHVLSTWLWQDVLLWQVLITIGNPIVLVPLITMFLFSGTKPGEATPAVRGYTTGAYFQSVRIFCSEAGGSVMQRFLLTREHMWRTILVSHVNGTWQTGERLTVLTGAMIPNAAGPAVASERSLSLLLAGVLRQAETLALADGFMILGCFTITALFVLAFLHPVPVPGAVNARQGR